MRVENRPVAYSLTIVCLLVIASAALAAGKSANMPTANPYLHNSFNPVSHENLAQTDAGHQPLALVSGILNLLLAVMGIVTMGIVTWNVEG
jgi:hypothetical protein